MTHTTELANMDHASFVEYIEMVRDDLIESNHLSTATDYTECIYRLKLYKEMLKCPKVEPPPSLWPSIFPLS